LFVLLINGCCPHSFLLKRILTSDFSYGRHRKETEKSGRDIGNAFSRCPANHRRVTSRNIERLVAEVARRETEENCLSVLAVRELKFNAIPRTFSSLRDLSSSRRGKDKRSRSAIKSHRCTFRTLHRPISSTSGIRR